MLLTDRFVFMRYNTSGWKTLKLMLSFQLCLGLPSGLFHSCFLTKTYINFPFSMMCPGQLILLRL